MTLATNQPQTIIHKKAGQLVPKEFFETALRKCPTVSGYAIRDTTDGNITIETDTTDKSASLPEMMLLNEQAKDYESIFHLANITQDRLSNLKEDTQPYELVTKDADDPDDLGTTVLSFSVEGDFPKYTDQASGHTDEYNFAHQVIYPMLGELLEDAEGDIGKFIAKLHRPSFETALMAHVGHRATFIFLPLEGDPIAFGNNTLGGEYEWGSVSQALGFGEEADQEPAPITAPAKGKKFTIFGRKDAAKEAKPITTDDKGVHHVGNTTIVDAKKELKASTVGPKGKVSVSPPPKMTDGTARNRWIRLFNNNKLPDNHLRKDLVLWVEPDVLPFAQRNISTIQEIKNLEDEIRTGNKPSIPKDMGAGMKAAHREIEQANTAKDYPEFLPTLTDAEMTESTKVLAGFLDRDKVPSALDIQKMEAKWGTFSEKHGIPFEDTLTWLAADAHALSHKALLLLWLETRRKVIEKMDVKDLIGTSVAKETAKHVAAKEVLKPMAGKKSSVLFGRKTG